MKQVNWTKVVGVGMALLAGAGAVVNALSEQQKTAEFNDMKKQLAELTKEKAGEA